MPTLHPPRPVTCPRCLSVEVAGATVCAHCGESLVTARLPDEDRDVVLVEKKAESKKAEEKKAKQKAEEEKRKLEAKREEERKEKGAELSAIKLHTRNAA